MTGRRGTAAGRGVLRSAALAAFAAGLALIAGAGAADPAAAPVTVDEAVARYLQAHGGLAAWDALQTLEVKGTYTAFSDDAPFTLRRRRPAAYRFQTRMLGGDYVEGFDGAAGWIRNDAGGIDWAVGMTPDETAAAWTDAEFDSPLVRWREKGHTVELAGRDDLDGRPVYRLEVTRKDGAKESWLLDAETFLEAGRTAPVTDFGVPFEQKIYYSDFRPVAGVMLPFHVEAEFFIRYRVTQIDSIAANPPLDPALFARPVDPGIARLAPLAGDWDVKVETRASPRAPWVAAATTATIAPLAGGDVLEETIAFTAAGRPYRATRLYSYDRFQDLYRLAYTDDFTGHLNVFAGKPGDDGRIALSNAETGTAWKTTEGTVTERQILHDLAADGFGLDLESSSDGGTTWSTDVRFSYQRKKAGA